MLGLGFNLADFGRRDGLIRLDRAFLDAVAAEDASLHARLLTARAAPEAVAGKDESDLVVSLGSHLDAFVARLFGIEAETAALARRTHALDPVHACKRLFVQRQATKKYPDPSGFDGTALRQAIEARSGRSLTERGFADAVAAWEADKDAEALDLAMRYAAWATLTEAGQAAHPGNTLFRRAAPARLPASGAGGDDRARRRDDAAAARA